MDEPGAVGGSGPLLRAVEKRVHEGAIAVPDGGMHDEAGRLVEDEDFGIFEKDRERYVLSQEDGSRLRRRGQGDLDDVSRLYFFRALLRPPFPDGNKPAVYPFLNLRARGLGQIVQVPEQNAVEALAGVAPVGADRAPGPERVDHAAAGAGAVLRRRAQSAAATATPQRAMNCDVDNTPNTDPRGSPRKSSITKRRSA